MGLGGSSRLNLAGGAASLSSGFRGSRATLGSRGPRFTAGGMGSGMFLSSGSGARLWRKAVIAPGTTFNISKGAMSFGFASKSFRFTAGTSGTRYTIGAEGTGLFYSGGSKMISKTGLFPQKRIIKQSGITTWIEFEPPDAALALSRALRDIPKSVTRDVAFMRALWTQVAQDMAKTIDKRFQQKGPGWKPLTIRYAKWKARAKARGKQHLAGSFGYRAISFTQIGMLTGTLRTSATELNKDANVTEVKQAPGWAAGMLIYKISGKDLPYAKWFNRDRPFFYLTDSEAATILNRAKHLIKSKIIFSWGKKGRRRRR